MVVLSYYPLNRSHGCVGWQKLRLHNAQNGLLNQAATQFIGRNLMTALKSPISLVLSLLSKSHQAYDPPHQKQAAHLDN